MNLPQGLLGSAGLTGLIVGLLLASAPAAFVMLALRRMKRTLQRRDAQAAATNRRNSAIVEGSGEGLLELDNAGYVRFANPAAVRMLGYEAEELPGLDYRVLINTEDDGRTEAVRKVRYTTNILGGVGALLRRKNGQHRPVEYRLVPVTEQGKSVGTVLVFRDISERVRVDNLLKEMQSTARVGGWEYDLQKQKVHWTEAVYDIHEVPHGQNIEPGTNSKYFSAADYDKLQAAAHAAAESGLASDLHVQSISARGRKMWLRVITRAERRNGITIRLHGTIQDVTDLVNAERQLRETRDFLELTLTAVPMPIAYVAYGDRDRTVTYANKAMEDWLGRTRAALVGRQSSEVFSTDSVASIRPHLEAMKNGKAAQARLTGMRAGAPREWMNYFVPQLSPAGELIGFFVIVYDLTEQKRLEARLLQAQKMEAIGQLTGGIAHDFNNLLGVVIGNLQLLERSISDTPANARKLHTAMRAAVRGADLTRRLLAFARREILDPTVLDLNRQLSTLTELMQRTLGESIEVRMVQTHDLWSTRVDAGQFENAILNLAINARDAMPDGGRLTVRTQNVTLDSVFCIDHPSIEPGEFICISVTDSGVGMEPEVLKRVFEPFFTTKESGKGSGLGLAMVHGFAEQAGGLATIASQPGRGTTVQVLLPRCLEAQSVREDTIVAKIAPGGSETILVVEDDADLRETVVTALTQLGYEAIAAANAAAALRILAGAQPVDLLFTDIMMPGGMLGPALAKRARELRPDIDVLFTTGYAENTVLSGTPGMAAVEVINKPYRNEDLAMRIRHVLDREARVA
ncbi:MAG: PAS domain-containing protein [Steroidobacter sp.]